MFLILILPRAAFFLKGEGQILNFPDASELAFLKSLVVNILLSEHQSHLATQSPNRLPFSSLPLGATSTRPFLSPPLPGFLFSRQLIALLSVSLDTTCLFLLWPMLHRSVGLSASCTSQPIGDPCCDSLLL